MIRIVTAALLTLGIAWTPFLQAQVNTQPPPAAQQPAADFSDTDLKSFAVALVEVTRINDVYLPMYQAARTPEEQKVVEKKATDEMVQAVRSQGLTVEKYQEILTVASVDPAVASKVSGLIKETETDRNGPR
jgi:hypothetical protein